MNRIAPEAALGGIFAQIKIRLKICTEMFIFIGNHMFTEYRLRHTYVLYVRSPIKVPKGRGRRNRPGSDVHILNFSYNRIIGNTNRESLTKA